MYFPKAYHGWGYGFVNKDCTRPSASASTDDKTTAPAMLEREKRKERREKKKKVNGVCALLFVV